ncbi:MAG TPA: ATP-binding protein [Gemmatimonadaceae bacterium]|nr:ATP-binding protein [Gemmatimonadaceae bacterium]
MEGIRILIVDDSADDVELVLRELRRAGLAFTERCVGTEPALRAALRDIVPDIVLCDHSLPGFMGRDALRIIEAERPGTPVIIVTGSIDEETAADYIKAGAIDYVVKHRLVRLGSAIRRALNLHRAVIAATDAQAALARSERRFRTLIEYSTDVITLLDQSARIIYSTQALKATLGYGPGELTGQLVFSLVHPDDRGAAESLFAAAVSRLQSVVRRSLRVQHRGGRWRELEVTAANHLDDAVVEAVVVNYRDITERVAAESALRKLEEQRRHAFKMEAIGRVASGVAHDFNNLLTVISSCTELALSALPPDHGVRPELTEVMGTVSRASGLTRQLLAFSREQPAAFKRVDLNALIANMSGLLRRLLGLRVSLRVIAAPNLEPILADPGQIEQVVMNLVVNARDAMPAGGRVTIETRLATEFTGSEAQIPGPCSFPCALLVVSDIGTGMTKETRARLFEPFFTTKRKGEGTGLGLSTVYGIVQQTGGCIDVKSTLGAGTTFSVYLPFASADAPSAAPHA